jgi:hypothetical protein
MVIVLDMGPLLVVEALAVVKLNEFMSGRGAVW